MCDYKQYYIKLLGDQGIHLRLRRLSNLVSYVLMSQCYPLEL